MSIHTQTAAVQQVVLDGESLTLENLWALTREGVHCHLSQSAWQKVADSRQRIEQVLAAGGRVYGVTTGFGKLSDVSIAANDIRKLQINLLRSHAMGVGKPWPTEVVRAMLVLRANALAKGYSGVRPETLNLLLELVNRHVHPEIPEKGSLGASGDLVPLAHMALVLVGEGQAEYQGVLMAGKEALTAAGLQPVTLEAKEGLALINGTQAMTAVGALAAYEAVQLGMAAEAAASLTMEALAGIIDAFDPELLATRPYPEQLQVGERMRQNLAGSRRVTHQGELRVQDAYSLRCVPQVHGASWQTVRDVLKCLHVELNSATDNPLVLADGRVLSGGQFHGEPVALAMDQLKVAAAEWASISERRVERLVNPQLSGLPAFLANHPGLESGLMIVQYVAAALVSENKVLAHPASVDSIPSSANQEDHVSMGTIGARQAREIVHNALRVVAIEWIAAAQAIWVQGADDEVSPVSRRRLQWLRKMVPPIEQDTSLGDKIEQVAHAFVEDGDWR